MTEQKKAKARERKPLKREGLNPSYEKISGSIATLIIAMAANLSRLVSTFRSHPPMR